MEKHKTILEDIKNYEPRLNQEWVQVLINLRMKYSKSFTRKRNSAAEAWRNILQEMIDLGAPAYITLDKIKKKWMNLIARYKHLKFTCKLEMITWPYFEQIDRAYSRNPNIVELRKGNSAKGSDSEESFVSDHAEYMMKKQKFTSTLIHLRYTYRHLFTGKKYAAQKGWMVIQNLLPNGQSYTIEQISKCWQNLIQRYKCLIENEKDHEKISWVHFRNMHEIMNRREDPAAVGTPAKEAPTIKTEQQSPSGTVQTIENESDGAQDVPFVETDEPGAKADPEVKNEPVEKKRKRQPAKTIADLLGYLAERDSRHDSQHEKIIGKLDDIVRLMQK